MFPVKKDKHLRGYLKEGVALLPKNYKPHDKDKKKHTSDLVKGMSMITQIGVMILVCVLIGLFAGRFLDNWLGTSPWLTLLFTFLGVGAAFKYMYEVAKKG